MFRQPEEAAAPRRPAPGLAQLEALIGEMADSGLPVDLAVSGERAGLPGSVDHAAYRIVQESLTNVVKHARAGSVDIAVHCDGEEIEISVTDDGIGFDPDGAVVTGFGVIGMRERVELAGGELSVARGPHAGTAIRARLPLG